MALGQDVTPVAEPEPGDNRFKDPEWSHNPYFDFWKQAYLVTSRWADDMLDSTPKGSTSARGSGPSSICGRFRARLSPSNFPLTNPEVLRETLRDQRREPRAGHVACSPRTWSKSGDLLKISQTDTAAFEVGRNLATTPGKVVFQNELFQLIQYAPTTDKVRERPLLIVPPWINKYYILDLTPAKSLIKFARRSGLHCVHHLLGQPGRAPLAQVLRGLHAGGHPHGGRRGEARDRRSRRSTSSAIASAARCWRRRSPISPRAARTPFNSRELP